MSEHLNALYLRLSNERMRLAGAKSESERIRHGVWVAQIEREIAGEYAFLSKADFAPAAVGMTDDELLAALMD